MAFKDSPVICNALDSNTCHFNKAASQKVAVTIPLPSWLFQEPADELCLGENLQGGHCQLCSQLLACCCSVKRSISAALRAMALLACETALFVHPPYSLCDAIGSGVIWFWPLESCFLLSSFFLH